MNDREPLPSAAMQVSGPDAVAWNETADVVIVGFGGAGAVTALQAKEGGASVIAIDRFAGGGATAYSGAVIYAGGTRYQRESGFEDTSEEMFKYLSAEGSAVTPETLRRFCDGSNADVEWLEKYGVPHGGNAYLGKVTFPPDGHWLYYSGNEKLPNFASRAKPAPRGHRVLTPGAGGHLHFAKLSASALASGVRLIQHAPVRRLVVDPAGVVLGVQINPLPESLWKQHNELYQVVSPWRPFNADRAERAVAECRKLEQTVHELRFIRARRGVVLASGGFIYNLDVLRKYRPAIAQNYRNLLRLGSMGDDGSGLELGCSVGGELALMENVCVGRLIAPPFVLPCGLIVNQTGERFINEDAYAFVLGGEIAAQPDDGKAWLILGANDFWMAVRQALFPGKGLFLSAGIPALMNILLGGTRRAATLDGLARKCSIDAAGLVRTVAAHNARVTQSLPDTLGKFPELMHSVSQSPFFAINMSLSNKFAPAPAFTLGGLGVDENTGAVKRADGTSVRGLYAAGRVAVGLCSKGYMSGLSIADTVFSGRRAGRELAGDAGSSESVR